MVKNKKGINPFGPETGIPGQMGTWITGWPRGMVYDIHPNYSGETFICWADVYLTFDMVPMPPPYEDARHPIEESFEPKENTKKAFRKMGIVLDKVCLHCSDSGL